MPHSKSVSFPGNINPGQDISEPYTQGLPRNTVSMDPEIGPSTPTRYRHQPAAGQGKHGKQQKRRLVKALSFKLKNKWEEVDRGEHADSLVVALKLLKRGGEINKSDVEKVLLDQYPGSLVRPTPADMDASLMQTPSIGGGLMFGNGQWAEYYGGDSRWHLGVIRRVFAKAPMDYRAANGGGSPQVVVEPKWEYSYNFGKSINVPPYLVRAPEEALKRTFGMRPFVFLQWALLRVESMTQFQEHHQRDFELMNFQFAAECLWEQFLNHPNNEDFKIHFESFDENVRKKLVDHLLSVFAGLDRLSKLNAPGSRWDFKNQNISIYTYPSLLGSGWLSCLIVLILQLSIPSLLLVGSISSSSRFSGFFSTTSEDFCRSSSSSSSSSEDGFSIVNLSSSTQLQGLIMNMFVLLLYSFRIAPQVFDVFYQTTGEGWTPASRLNSLRAVVWDRGADTLPMQFGFRVERLVKSCYMSLVCLVMLFSLFLSDSVLDIVLNALAIEFVWQIDVEYAKSPNWDPKRRWIKAGAVECRIRATLDLQALSSPQVFCEAYGIPLDSYREAFDGELLPIKSQKIAGEDALDEDYMTETDVIWNWASEIAKKQNLGNAIWQFSPHLVQFGWFDSLWIKLGFTSSRGMFRRFTEYRTWSIWERVLFLSPVPNPGKVDELLRMLKSTQETMSNNKSKSGSAEFVFSSNHFGLTRCEYINFDPKYNIQSPFERFARQVMEVLQFRSLYRSLRVAMRTKSYASIPFRIVDGLLEWLSYLIQVSFPTMLMAMGGLILVCY